MSEGISPKKRTTIYVDPNVHKAFKRICYREDKSVSEKIETFEARYIAVHGDGNPNLLLDPWLHLPAKTCFNCEKITGALVKVKFVSGLVAEVCPECLDEKRSHGLVKHVFGGV